MCTVEIQHVIWHSNKKLEYPLKYILYALDEITPILFCASLLGLSLYNRQLLPPLGS
jgi:hypothetical protein